MAEARFLPGVVGHDSQKRQALAAIRAGRFEGSYLFHGGRGRGKATFALALAQALLCPRGPLACEPPCPSCRKARSGSHADLELRARGPEEGWLKIDAIRSLRAAYVLRPLEGSRRIGVIDDAETMNDEASNALLKLLEEPPPGGVLILVSENAAALLPTIRSRCRKLHFGPLTDAEVRGVLGRRGIADAERAAVLSEGSPGRAIRLAEDGRLDEKIRLACALVAATGDPARAAGAVDAAVREGTAKLEGARENLRDLVSLAQTLVRMDLRRRAGRAVPLRVETSSLERVPADSLERSIGDLLRIEQDVDLNLGLPLLVETALQRAESAAAATPETAPG